MDGQGGGGDGTHKVRFNEEASNFVNSYYKTQQIVLIPPNTYSGCVSALPPMGRPPSRLSVRE